MPFAAEHTHVDFVGLFQHADDLGVAGERLDIGQAQQFAEAATEGEQVVERQLLRAHEDHLVIEPGAVERGEVTIVEPADVDAGDFGAEPRRQGYELERAGHQAIR